MGKKTSSGTSEIWNSQWFFIWFYGICDHQSVQSEGKDISGCLFHLSGIITIAYYGARWYHWL